MTKGGSFEQSVEFARGKFTGMDCGVYDERGKSLSVIGLTRSTTGVYEVPSAVTGVYLNRKAIAQSGVKVLSLEKCSNLRKFEIRAPKNPLSDFWINELTIIMPKDNSLLQSISISLLCHKFSLSGECRGIDLSIYACHELEIDKFVLENASSLYFSNCTGIKSICIPDWNSIDAMYLLNTDTEYLSCRLRGKCLRLTCCLKLKVMSVSFDRLDIHELLRIANRGFNSLGELNIKVLKLLFPKLKKASDTRVINLSRMSCVLNRISFTTVKDGFREYGFDSKKKYTLIVPSRAEFTMSKELEPYFTVVRK